MTLIYDTNPVLRMSNICYVTSHYQFVNACI